MIKHHAQKQCGKKIIYFTLQLSGHTPSPKEASAGTQGRNLDAETEAEAKGGCCLQACSPWVATTYLPKDGTTPSGPGLPTSIINQENINQDLSIGNLMEAFPQLLFFFLDTSSLGHLDKINQPEQWLRRELIVLE